MTVTTANDVQAPQPAVAHKPAALTDDERKALHDRYAVEREKRLRTDGVQQYKPLNFALKLTDDEDPYTKAPVREPLKDHVGLLFLGGGFAALTCCARLKQLGIEDLRILESGGGFGGVWYWNRFPGAMCDTAAMIYLPFIEEVGTVPTQKYVRGPEILAHAQRMADHFDLNRHALFSTQLETLTWDEDRSVWIVRTRQGDEFTADHVAMGTGPLNKPHLPGVPGLETFKGEAFHTSRWDFEASGGDWSGAPMTKLNGKRVGVIGTGATAVQCVPELGRDAGELFVFQRTPSAVGPRNNAPIDPEWFKSLPKGWNDEWQNNFVELMSQGYTSSGKNLVDDGWTDSVRRITDRMVENAKAEGKSMKDTGFDDLIRAYHQVDDVYMNEVRQRCDDIVQDPKTANGLKAWYRQFCKRPCFHDEYLPAFNLPNVHLVDTNGKGVEQIDETGVWVNGEHYDLDVIVYATGFEFNSSFTYRAGIEVYGKGGVKLSDAWSNGMKSLNGMHTTGFPNMFVCGTFQGSGLNSNFSSNYVDQGITIAKILQAKKDIGAKTFEPTEEAQEKWTDLIASAPRGLFGGKDCTPGYYNTEGQEEGTRELRDTGRFPAGALAFFKYIGEWRSNGKFDGLVFDGKPADLPSN